MKKFLSSVKSFGKRAFPAVIVALSSFAAFAEDAGGGNSSLNTTEATTAIQSWVTGLTSWIGTIAPHITSLLSAIFGITLIFVVWKWVQRGTKKG